MSNLKVPRSYKDIARFTEAYKIMCSSDNTLRCFSSGTPLAGLAANSGLEAIKVYNQFPKVLREKMKFDGGKILELESMCKKELEI